MTDKELFTYLVSSGMIDRTTLERDIKMQKRQKYLDQHKYSIWQGKDGKWHTCLPCEGGRRKIKRNEKSALEEAIADFYESQEYNPTFENLFEEWVEQKLRYKEICKGTFDRYKEDYKRFLKGTDFAQTKVGKITEDDIENIIRETIIGLDLKRKSFSNYRTLIIGVFKYAKRKKLTKISISAFFSDLDLSKKMFKREVRIDENQVFTAEEVKLLIAKLKEKGDVISLGIAFDFYTGLRSGELAALRYSDLVDDKIHIQRQQVRYKDENGKYVYEIVDYTKTEQGDRYVYITKPAAALLREIHMKAPFDDNLFPNLRKLNFDNRLRRTCKEIGINPRSMHKIRKTYGTFLIDSGVEDSLIMSQMGHKDIQTTRSYYYFANKDNDYKKQQIEQAISF